MSYTCKDCKYWHRLGVNFGRCDADEREYWEETPFCIHFKTDDGKRPRFCRLASSVDEMAKEITKYRIHIYAQEHGGIDYIEADNILDEAKQELMELEE